MMPSTPARRSVWVVCLGLAACSYGAFVWGLDRYPLVFVDEPFFNLAPIRYLHGQGFTSPVRDDAPYGDTLWAYHAPLYPRLQLVTFSLLGISDFAARVPSWTAAHLALVLVLVALLRRGRSRAALFVAVAWLGDRAIMELMYGRMDGLAVLCLAGMFVTTLAAVEQPSRRAALGIGLCAGLAGAFHPSTVIFSTLVGLLLLCLPYRPRWHLPAAMVLGAVPGVLVLLACWWPSPSHAVEQLRWHLGLCVKGSLSVCFQVMRWSRFEVAGLGLAWAAVLVPAAVRQLLRRREQAPDAVLLVATVFAAGGVAVMLKPPVFPYYVSYFSLWPLIGLGARFELSRGWRRTAGLVVLLAVWLPSLAWNSLRWRELLLHYHDLDRRWARQCLAEHIPPDVPLTGSPEYYLVAPEAGLNYRPLPWYGRGLTIPPSTWLVLTADDYDQCLRVSAAEQAARPVVYRGPLQPGSRHLGWPAVILGPRADADGPPGTARRPPESTLR